MSDILENAKQHFRDKVSGEMSFVEVPEWGTEDKPLKIYFRSITLKQKDRIYKYIREGSLESLAMTLVVRALDEEGKPLFKPVHKTELMNSVDSEVIERIVNQMYADDESLDDAVKN
jgi:Asp-tRNA(Asn)/Glu-tRNA(Gln) amidotransferase B subunit